MTDFIGNILTQMSSAFNQSQTEDLEIQLTNDKTLKWRGLHNNQFASCAAKKRNKKDEEDNIEDDIDDNKNNDDENDDGNNNEINDSSESDNDNNVVKKVRYRTRNQVNKSEREKKENQNNIEVQQPSSSAVTIPIQSADIIPKIEENDVTSKTFDKSVILEGINDNVKKIQRKRKKNDEKQKEEIKEAEEEIPKRRSRNKLYSSSSLTPTPTTSRQQQIIDDIKNVNYDKNLTENLIKKTKDSSDEEMMQQQNTKINEKLIINLKVKEEEKDDEEGEEEKQNINQKDTPTNTTINTKTTITTNSNNINVDAIECNSEQQPQQPIKLKRGRKKKIVPASKITNETDSNKDLDVKPLEEIIKIQKTEVEEDDDEDDEQKINNISNSNNNNNNNSNNNNTKKRRGTKKDLNTTTTKTTFNDNEEIENESSKTILSSQQIPLSQSIPSNNDNILFKQKSDKIKMDTNCPNLEPVIKVPKKRGRKPKILKYDDDNNYVLPSVKKSQRFIKEQIDNVSSGSGVNQTNYLGKDNEQQIILPPPQTTIIQQRLSRRIKPTAKILANDELRYGFEQQNNARLSLSSENLEQDDDQTTTVTTSAASSATTTTTAATAIITTTINLNSIKEIVDEKKNVKEAKKKEENIKRFYGVVIDNNLPETTAKTSKIETTLITSPEQSTKTHISTPSSPTSRCPDPLEFLNEIKIQKIALNRSPEDNKKLNKKQQKRLIKLKEKHFEKLGLCKNTKININNNNNNNNHHHNINNSNYNSDYSGDEHTEDDNDEFVPYKKVQVGRPGVTLRIRNQRQTSTATMTTTLQQHGPNDNTKNILDNKINTRGTMQSSSQHDIVTRRSSSSIKSNNNNIDNNNKQQSKMLMTFRKRKLNPNAISSIQGTSSDEVISLPGTSTNNNNNCRLLDENDLLKLNNNHHNNNYNMQQQLIKNQNNDNNNNCLCQVKSKYYVKKTNELQYCVGEDQIDEHIIGCSNEISHKNNNNNNNNNVDDIDDNQLINLLRPSIRVSYMILCDSHKKRLYSHNCCAGCGIFCSQGKFAMCPKNHVFHRDCATKFILNTPFDPCTTDFTSPTLSLKCPHCGLDVLKDEYRLTLKCSSNSVFLPKNMKPARMSYERKIVSRTHSLRLEIEKMIPEQIFDTLFKAENNLSLAFMNFTTKDLFYAVHHDNVQRVAEIIASGFDITTSFIEFQNGTCLHLVCSFGSLSMTYLILCRLSSSDFMNLMDNELRTPLMCSIIAEKHDILKLLLQCGADATLKGADGLTALHLAAKRGNFVAAEILLNYHRQSLSAHKFKSFINSIDDGNWTSLVWAAENGFSNIVISLINMEADVNICDTENNIALHWAALSNKIETILPILQTNCDFNLQNVNGDTPLHISCRLSNTHISLILLAHGADLNIKNGMNETPYDCIPDEQSQCARTILFNIQIRQIVLFPDRKVLLPDISNGRETFPIKLIQTSNQEYQDEIDEPVIPDFRYITKSILLQNSIQIDQRVSQMRICSCPDDCSSEHCQCSAIALQNWYTIDGRLKNEFNFLDPAMIFECNDVCGCNKLLCKNRVVQNGIKLPLQVFECDEKQKGWGVQCLTKIKKGTFIAEYVGEILTVSESDRRTDDSYFFDLGSFDNCIDANFYGNVSRFLNHSCSPNVIPIRVYFDHQDLRFPKIAFFASKDIDINEEITFDYGEKFWTIKYKNFTCHCNTTECKYSKTTISKTLEEYNQRNSSG